jgi:hypothetical protein
MASKGELEELIHDLQNAMNAAVDILTDSRLSDADARDEALDVLGFEVDDELEDEYD